MNEALEKALARQQEITETARAENRDLTESETREFETLQGIIDSMDKNEEPSGGERNETGDEPDTGYSHETATEIIQMCRSFDIEPDDFISRGISVEEARREIINQLMNENKPINTGITVTKDENDKFRAAVADGILLRSGIDVEKPAEGANLYRSLPIREIAIECSEREKSGTEDYRHMTSDNLYDMCLRSFYNPTAAFPAILDDVVKKSYVAGMEKARTSFEKWVKFGTLSNFKKTTNHEYLMSLGGELAEVPENGELKAYVPRDVAMPERQLKTYGKQFTMSRQAFINDDIGLLASMSQRYAELSKRTQNNLIYSILLNNKKIFDNKVLFSDERKNTLKSGTDVTLAAISKMIYMLGMQKDEAGNQLRLLPDFFIVPLGLGTPLRTLLYSPTINTPDNTMAVNPYANQKYEVIEDVTLNSFIKDGEPAPWFMGVKGEIIQVDYLNGQAEATIRRSERPGTLGFVWDVYHDFGISVRHPQAIVRNPGVAINLGE